MKSSYIFFISLVIFLCSIIFFAYYYELILFNLPQIKTKEAKDIVHYEKKTVTLHFWHQDSWQKEDTEILWSTDTATSTQYILRSWLNLLDEENIIPKKVSLQSVLLAPSGNELYISFDRSPLQKEVEIYQKLMWIEGLIKTLKNNGLEFSSINFLVHHHPLSDNHLDFTQSWPGDGFTQSIYN